jgi:hypothetical protein
MYLSYLARAVVTFNTTPVADASQLLFFFHALVLCSLHLSISAATNDDISFNVICCCCSFSLFLFLCLRARVCDFHLALIIEKAPFDRQFAEISSSIIHDFHLVLEFHKF